MTLDELNQNMQAMWADLKQAYQRNQGEVEELRRDLRAQFDQLNRRVDKLTMAVMMGNDHLKQLEDRMADLEHRVSTLEGAKP